MCVCVYALLAPSGCLPELGRNSFNYERWKGLLYIVLNTLIIIIMVFIYLFIFPMGKNISPEDSAQSILSKHFSRNKAVRATSPFLFHVVVKAMEAEAVFCSPRLADSRETAVVFSQSYSE